jgi:hypothetical protein
MSIESAIAEMIQREGVVVPMMVGFFIVAGITVATIGKVIRSCARERTRRDIAAYIAEGSMTADQGERLMKAGEPRE